MSSMNKQIPHGGEIQKQESKSKISVPSLLSALKTSSSTKNVEKGREIHTKVIKNGYGRNIKVASTLIDMYSKCGCTAEARSVFDSMIRRDVVAWTSLILGYAQNGRGEAALDLFSRMLSEARCEPNSYTFVAALKACTSLASREHEAVKLKALETGMAIHSRVARQDKEMDSTNLFVANTLVDMYSKCGSVADARRVFNGMVRHSLVSWTALILGCSQNGKEAAALELFSQMLAEFEPDRSSILAAVRACTGLAAKEEGRIKLLSLEQGMAIHARAASQQLEKDMVVANAFVDMYAKCGSLVDSQGVFDGIEQHDVISWTALISGYVEDAQAEVALDLFARMIVEGRCLPDDEVFVVALQACGNIASLEFGKALHGEIARRCFESNIVVANCLVDFYGRCGSMVQARQVFDAAPSKDIVTWNALMAGYSRRGNAGMVLELLHQMQDENFQPNAISFLSVLSSCSRAGVIDKGKSYFQAMVSKFGVSPSMEHFHCMVDLLCRNHEVSAALALVESKMASQATEVTWMTLLAGCRKWKNVEVARIASEKVLALNSKNTAARLLMLEICRDEKHDDKR